MEGDGVEEKKLAEKAVGVGGIWKHGQHVRGRDGVEGAGDAVRREEIVTLV